MGANIENTKAMKSGDTSDWQSWVNSLPATFITSCVIDSLLGHLHAAIDGGDLSEATATIENLDMYMEEHWCEDQDDSFNWMYPIYLDMLKAAAC